MPIHRFKATANLPPNDTFGLRALETSEVASWIRAHVICGKRKLSLNFFNNNASTQGQRGERVITNGSFGSVGGGGRVVEDQRGHSRPRMLQERRL
jgi:hypothetical protein